MRILPALLACLLLTVAFLVGRWSSTEATTTASKDAPESAPIGHGEAEVAHRADTVSPEPVREAPPDVVSPAQLDQARAAALGAWSDMRSQPMPEDELQSLLASYAETLRTMPGRMAKERAEAANKKDADAALLRSDDLLGILRQIERDDPGLAPLAKSPARFASLFAARVGGTTHDGRSLTPSQPLADGATITFPAGVFPLRDLSREREPFPSDITVRGAGMDRTLLVAEALRPRGALARFALEDCTIFADNSIAHGGAEAELALRRVRVVGFDCGAGSSVAIYAIRQTAVLAQDCRFEGGYGRSPMHSNLIDSRNILVARFENCTFDRMDLSGADSSSMVFANCAMTDLFGALPNGPVYENCRAQSNELYAQGRWQELTTAMRRDLNQLFPDWQAQLQAARR